jgi:hypothetical protein
LREKSFDGRVYTEHLKRGSSIMEQGREKALKESSSGGEETGKERIRQLTSEEFFRNLEEIRGLLLERNWKFWRLREKDRDKMMETLYATFLEFLARKNPDPKWRAYLEKEGRRRAGALFVENRRPKEGVSEEEHLFETGRFLIEIQMEHEKRFEMVVDEERLNFVRKIVEDFLDKYNLRVGPVFWEPGDGHRLQIEDLNPSLLWDQIWTAYHAALFRSQSGLGDGINFIEEKE